MVENAPARRRDDVTVAQKCDDDSTLPKGRFKGKPRGLARFKEREVARALRAAKRAGGVTRVQLALETGHINYIFEGPATQAGNDLDEWIAKKNARQA
jgi:hypothetical protein